MAGMPSPQMAQVGSAPQTPPNPAAQNPSSPLSSLAGGPSKGGSPLLQMILTFLAGAGVGSMAESLKKLTSVMAGGAGGSHKAGAKVGAPPPQQMPPPQGGSPAQIPPQMDPQKMQLLLKMLAAQQGQGGPE